MAAGKRKGRKKREGTTGKLTGLAVAAVLVLVGGFSMRTALAEAGSHRELALEGAAAEQTSEGEPGDQLPTVRGLAADVEVNYNTVSKVYMSLEQDGYIQSKRRQGAFVLDVSDKPGVSISSTAEIVTSEYLKRCFELGMSLEDIEQQFALSLNEAKTKRDAG